MQPQSRDPQERRKSLANDEIVAMALTWWRGRAHLLDNAALLVGSGTESRRQPSHNTPHLVVRFRIQALH